MAYSLYKKTILDNGLRIITEKVGHVRSVTLGVWIDAGSRNEIPSECGVSHFIEHMLFKGTVGRTAKDIAMSLESLGGTLNAFTSREQTCFYARILDEHLLQAVDVLSDILKNSLITNSDFEKERKVILEELKDLQDTPSDLVHDILMQNIWQNQSLGQPIIGTEKSLLHLARQQLLSYLKRNYCNSNVVIAACGNLKHQLLVDMVKKHFSFSPACKNLQKKEIPISTEKNLKVVEKDSAQTHICLGVPGFPYDVAERYAMLILSDILGGGMSSRLFQSIREDLGLAYNIYSYLDFFKDSGLFGIYLATDKKQAIQAIHSVFDQIKQLKVNKLTSEELGRAKSQLKGELTLSLESTSSLMMRLARNELYLRSHIDVNHTLRSIDKVSSDDIWEISNDLFNKDGFCLAILGPTDKGILKKVDWDRLG